MVSTSEDTKRDEVLQQLSSDSSHLRLQAARHLSRTATAADLTLLRQALRKEAVSFVKRALEQAIARIGSGRSEAVEEANGTDGPADKVQRAYTRAVEWVTNSLLHEILPRFGAIRLEARKAVTDYENSILKVRIDGLAAILEGIEELRKAAVSESVKEFNLYDLIESVITEETRHCAVKVSAQGSRDLVVVADPNLLMLAVGNALHNALEASATTETEAPVVISWGATEVDYWVTVLDQGPGITGPLEAAFGIGSTTKSGHRGFGLAIARQAMTTLDGSVTLQPASGGGARLEIRWFR